MNVDVPRRRLRQILAGDRCVVASSVFDPLSARIGDELGFEVGLMGGSIASLAVLGAPDIVLLTLTELCEQVHRTCRAGTLSVIVDADHGYGNALNVMRTVEELEAAGAAGISIEDTLLPPPFGAPQQIQLTSVEEGAGKMRAAVQARSESGPAIFARTSAASVTGLDDAVARFGVYTATGVDALFLPGLRTREELDRIAAPAHLPLIVAAPHESLVDVDYLASRGVRVLAQGHKPFFVALQALYDALKAVKDGVPPSQQANAAPASLIDAVTDASTYRERMREFMEG